MTMTATTTQNSALVLKQTQCLGHLRVGAAPLFEIKC